jgi:hypothetical protein
VDTIAPLHQVAPTNRLAITLDNDLCAMARAHAVADNLSLGKAISDLLRTRQAARPVSAPTSTTDISTSFSIDPDSLLPVVKGGARPVTSEDVERGLDDDDLRYLTAMGDQSGILRQSALGQAARST